jgi:mRNA-degrading endonuclease RelE of RelBE toxin-antitoxin system
MMTKTQIKSEIQKVLDEVPENLLPDILDFLKELQEQPTKKVQLTNHLRKILLEDKVLLEKLAK